jgi:thioredoxin reductase (NADPH)
MGPDLMAELRAQALRFGAEIMQGDVASVDVSSRPFTLNVSGKTFHARSLILATGASAKWLDLGVDKQLSGRGVSTCATCDGFFFKGRRVAVVGGGDTALEEATYLTKFASRVHLVHRRDTLRGSKIMADRALANPKIVPVWNTVVEEVLGNDSDGVTGVRVKNLKNGTAGMIESRGMFVAIGHTPNTKFLGGQVETDKTGYLLLKDGFRSLTSVEGVFAAGDCADSIYRQAVTAAGMGCKAAIDAERWLAEKGIH